MVAKEVWRQAAAVGPLPPIDVKEAAVRLGMSRRTLERALAAGAGDIEGGPWDTTPDSKHRTWRFDPTTLHAWWRSWGAVHQAPAKVPMPKRKVRRAQTALSPGKRAPVNYYAALRTSEDDER